MRLGRETLSRDWGWAGVVLPRETISTRVGGGA